MKYLVMIFFLFSSVLFAQQDEKLDENVQKQMEKEKKYADEQKFYFADEYDFEGAEVDEKSLDKIPEQPDYNDDFNMDWVYN